MSDETNATETPEEQSEQTGDTAAEAPPAPDAAAMEAELADVKEQMLRVAADAENAKRRAAKEVADAKAYALTSFARDLLAVDDNLHRALQSVTEAMRATLDDGATGLLAGVEMTRKELHDALGRQGVKPIASETGVRFDPNFHQAVAQIPGDTPKDHIIDTVQTGWRIGDRTLRAAMVSVSAGQPGAPAPTEAAPNEATGATADAGVEAQPANDATSEDGAAASDEGPASTSPGGRVDTTI